MINPTRNTRSSAADPKPVEAPPMIAKTEDPVVTGLSADVPMIIKDEEPAPTEGKFYSEEELMKLKKINFKKKVTGKEKRVRQNRKLFRMLTPRNAIAALNELHGESVGQSVVTPTASNQFEAEITINNIRYVGVGNSKMQAKNSASEKALRDLVINKFQQIKKQEIANPIQASTADSEDMDTEEDKAEDDKADDVPMLQLASFALHKLFSEWEAEGFEIPLPRSNPETAAAATSVEGAKPNTPKPPKIRNELPPNNLTMHPVMLLSTMRPGLQYSDLGSEGITPNILHRVGATVDGENFIGEGRSKKDARKRAATQILIKLFEWKGACC